LSYRLVYTQKAVRDIDRLDAGVKKRIGTTLLRFKDNPLQYAERLIDPELGGHRRVPASFYENYHIPVPDLITQQQLITEIAVHETNIAAAQNVLATAAARKQAVMQHYL
jgi:restriction endonuclease S subunit